MTVVEYVIISLLLLGRIRLLILVIVPLRIRPVLRRLPLLWLSLFWLLRIRTLRPGTLRWSASLTRTLFALRFRLSRLVLLCPPLCTLLALLRFRLALLTSPWLT